MASNIKNTSDLRKFLLSAMEDVRNGNLDYQDASAISKLSAQILQSARLDLDHAQAVFKGEVDGTDSAPLIVDETAMLETKELGDE